MAQPIAEAFGVGLVDIACHGIDMETLGDFIMHLSHIKDDAHGQNVIDLLKGDVLVLHLAPDAVRCLYAGLYLIADARFVQLLTDGGCKLVKLGIQIVLHAGKITGYLRIFLGMFVTEAEVFQFLLYLVQSQAVGQRGIDVKGFAGNLVLFVGQLAAQGTHIVQTIRNLDKDYADVITHRKQEFLE